MKSSNTVCHTFRSIAQFHLCALTYVLNFCWNTDLISIRTIAATYKVDFSCDETPRAPGSIPCRALKIHYFWNALTGSKHFFHKRSWFFLCWQEVVFCMKESRQKVEQCEGKVEQKAFEIHFESLLNSDWSSVEMFDFLLKPGFMSKGIVLLTLCVVSPQEVWSD